MSRKGKSIGTKQVSIGLGLWRHGNGESLLMDAGFFSE
jgi:hypothetical protein